MDSNDRQVLVPLKLSKERNTKPNSNIVTVKTKTMTKSAQPLTFFFKSLDSYSLLQEARDTHPLHISEMKAIAVVLH